MRNDWMLSSEKTEMCSADPGILGSRTILVRRFTSATVRVNDIKQTIISPEPGVSSLGWLRGTVVERRSLTGELSLSCTRPAADG